MHAGLELILSHGPVSRGGSTSLSVKGSVHLRYTVRFDLRFGAGVGNGYRRASENAVYLVRWM
jgi:hypothetical protein